MTASTSDRFVGDLLVRIGVIDASGLAQAKARSGHGTTLGRVLASLGLVAESVTASAVASALHLEYIENPFPEVSANVAALLPAEFCRKRGAVPLGLDGNRLRLAIFDAMDDGVLRDVGFKTGKTPVAVVVTQTVFEQLCAHLYPEDVRATAYALLDGSAPVGEIEATGDTEYDLIDPAVLAKDIKQPPIIRLVNQILSDAATAGASDIHIEPQEGFLQVRQRVDGLLRDVLTIPHHLQDLTISRLKIMSGMDISERRKPQDGRSRLRFEGRRIDLRVSSLPTHFGEKVVIRLDVDPIHVSEFDQVVEQ